MKKLEAFIHNSGIDMIIEWIKSRRNLESSTNLSKKQVKSRWQFIFGWIFSPKKTKEYLDSYISKQCDIREERISNKLHEEFESYW